VTIDDVAKRAGVSRATVSQTLNGNRPVSEATKALVDQAIAELGFRRNQMARSFRQQRSGLIAVVIANILHTSHAAIARAVMAGAHAMGYMTAIYDVEEDPELQTQTVLAMADRGVDGVLFFGLALPDADAAILLQSAIPFVEMRQTPPPDADWDTVGSDAAGGVVRATTALARAASGPVAFFGGPPADLWTPARLAGFRGGMAEAGRSVDERLIQFSKYTIEGGQRSFDQAFDAPERPSAIVCANDMIALGAMGRALDEGLRIPEDLMISGFDNIDICEIIRPTLTSIENHPSRWGRAASDLLLSRLDGTYEGPARQVILPTDLIQRASTA
jgi:DNA-binding LacI/PurR family transcriptional regulator